MNDAPRDIFITFHAMSRAKSRRIADRKRGDDADAQREWDDCSLSRWLRERADEAIKRGTPLPTRESGARRYAHEGLVFVLSADLARLATVHEYDPHIEQSTAPAPNDRGEHRGQRRRRLRAADRVRKRNERRGGRDLPPAPGVGEWEDAA